jgi:hypothetical protein
MILLDDEARETRATGHPVRPTLMMKHGRANLDKRWSTRVRYAGRSSVPMRPGAGLGELSDPAPAKLPSARCQRAGRRGGPRLALPTGSAPSPV